MQNTASKQNKVLIIEDTRSFAMLLQQLLLDKAGLPSDVAHTKAEAKTLLAENAQSYFAAIVDLNLPDAPNGEATEVVVASALPAVVFTSTDDQAVKDDLWSRGIADYAIKSGSHSLDYICWILKRLQKNADVKVLVVDDSASARKNMEKLLQTQRYQTYTVESGEQALAFLEDHSDITLCIVDFVMKGMSGLELAAKIHETHSREDLEIIGVSSERGAQISAKFIKSGASEFLPKPFVPEEFLCRINHAVDRVESYAQLRDLNQQKNKLIGTAAHDIRGPVGAIKTAADYILNRNPSEARQSSLLHMIETSASSLLDLLADLLDVSVIEAGELKLNLSHENLCKLVEERVNLYRAQAEEKQLRVSVEGETALMVDLDPVKMRQVVDNLLTNAIKYSHSGGQVLITIETSAEHAILRVEDAGDGVPEAEQHALFDAYRTLSTQTTAGEKATGLGLAIVKNVVQAHSGKIYYETSSIGGACFGVRIPLKNE